MTVGDQASRGETSCSVRQVEAELAEVRLSRPKDRPWAAGDARMLN